MNAFDPIPPRRADDAGSETVAPLSLANAARAVRTLSRLSWAGGYAALALAVMWRASGHFPAFAPLDAPVLTALGQIRLIPLALSSLLLALAGLGGALILSGARRRAAMPEAVAPASSPPEASRMKRRWRAITARLRPGHGDPALIGRAARWPQAIFVTGAALAAAGAAWMPASGYAPILAATNFAFGAAALALAFPLLIAERLLAATPEARLPEAPALRALLLLPVLTWSGAGLIQIAAGMGMSPVLATRLDAALAVPLTLIAAELMLRALARCFLPPPAPAAARAAIESLLARVLAEGVRSGGIAAPVRQHLGIDFSRSWALAYLRSAVAPVALLLGVIAWGLTGMVMVGLDQRVVEERFGAPVAVLQPGIHAILPWPLGKIRRVEFGTLHETTLTAMYRPVRVTGAEDLPPPEADRLWEQAHAGELDFLIASQSAQVERTQSFQIVSADIQLRYRIGMTDHAALAAAYRVDDPAAALRAVAGREIARHFAGRTLDAVLGENREAMADGLRDAVQRELDRLDLGVEVAAIVIEAIHPPAGAAEAYHAVRAAEIEADASISAERGKALATRADALRYGADIVAQARGAGAEATGTAAADLANFTADHASAVASPDSFLLERRLSALSAALEKSELTVIDHRIPAADAPMLDLRTFSPATAASTGPAQE